MLKYLKENVKDSAEEMGTLEHTIHYQDNYP